MEYNAQPIHKNITVKPNNLCYSLVSNNIKKTFKNMNNTVYA